MTGQGKTGFLGNLPSQVKSHIRPGRPEIFHARTVHLVLMARVGQKSEHRRQVMQRCIFTGYTTSSTSPNTPMEHMSRQFR
jgi:hypothetical protein